MREAELRDGVPQTAGWFVINVRDGPWRHSRLRSQCRFGGEGDAHFDDLGIGLFWLEPGQAMAMYHHEAGQEDFLVLRGRCVLVVEGEERALEAWDFVHCPPRTGHTIVAGHEPALVLGVGARKERGSARYPSDPVALAHGAAVRPGESPDDAYARFGPDVPGPPPEEF